MSTQDERRSQKIQGIAAAPGLVMGEVFVWRKEYFQIPRYTIDQADAELSRFRAALTQAREEVRGLWEKVAREVGASEGAVFEAHLMFLEDTSLLEMAEEAIRSGQNAEGAWMDAIDCFTRELEKLPDELFSARAIDVRDVGKRVLQHLLGKSRQTTPVLPRPMVLVAQDLEPSETAGLDKTKVLGFCTADGGATSHTAILAKALGLPAVVGLGSSILDLPNCAPVLVDGSNGIVISFPSPDEQATFQRLREQAMHLSQEEAAKARQPAVTQDGKVVEIVANIGSVQEAANALNMGAEGVGLLRTEFLYLGLEIAPTEAEQLAAYQKILELFGSRPVVVRTLDVGGDKQLAYLDLGKEANPFLGWRAIRMCLDRPEFFKVQLRALLRASPGHDLRIMFPMVSTLQEVRKAKELLSEVRRDLERQEIPIAGKIQVGIMVEIPSTVILADQFACEVDFFSIGTNDLTQYTFAAERTNERVAHLGDAIHPAILRQISSVIQAAHMQKIWVGVCGELAGDPIAIPLLLGLGLDEFSMAPASIPHAKEVVRRISTGQAQALAMEAIQLDSAEAVRQHVRNHLAEVL